MDSTSALQQLFALTGKLQPSAAAPPHMLHAARVAVARSLLSEAPQMTAPAVSGLGSIDPDLSKQLEAALAEAATMHAAQPGQRFMVHVRQLPVISSLHPGSAPPAAAGMAAAQTFGPFLGGGQRPYWIDLYPVVVQATVTRSPAGSPFLSIPVEIFLYPVDSPRLTLGAGSFWFQSPLLAGGAPAGSWTGLKIKGGSITFSAAPSYAGGTIEIANSTTVTVTLQLDFVPAQAGGSGPGGDARAAVAQLPSEVTIVFGPSGATITAASDATLTAYGITAGMTWHSTAPQYQAALQQIVVPLTPSITTFAPLPAVSDLFGLSDSAPVTQAGWGLPVAITTAAALGQAAGAGSLVLELAPGLTAQWRGTNAPVAANQAWLSVSAGAMLFLAPGAANSRLTEEYAMWQESAPSTRRSTLDIAYPKPFPLIYLTVSSSGTIQSTEIVWTAASITAHIDRPLEADGSRLGPRMPGVVFLYETSAGAFVLVDAAAVPAGVVPLPIAFSLHNALLTTTPPQSLLIVGKLGAGNSLDAGGLQIAFGLYSLLPAAPDPYAANFYPIGQQTFGVAGYTSYEPSAAASNLPAIDATVIWPSPGSPALSFVLGSLQGLHEQVSILQPTPDPETSSQDPVALQNQRYEAALRGMFDEAIGASPESLFLLDVSSNADQLGVGLGTPDPARTTGGGGTALAISGLDLVTPGVNLRTFTTPQIQWEPVINIPNPDGPFPSPVAFWDDGGPTLMGSPTVDLVPIAPIPVINKILNSYQQGNPAAVLFTLPFGMKAVATLPKPSRIGPLPVPRPGLAMLQPEFTDQNLTGGRQVSMTAARPLFEILGSPAASPSLPGATVQLRNLIDPNLNPLDVSILGNPVDPIFNGTFAPPGSDPDGGGKFPAVPVTRMDLSGYGASMFSDWVDPSANPPAVVQARFDVMAGRTAYEVVKVKSILYPWGAVVVRTVTIQRSDNAEVLRWDSGWVAATPGTFDLPNGITVHPGAVRGMYNIRNIRDTSQVYKGSGGVEMTAVYFDADAQIDDVTTGGQGGFVPTAGQFGFVQELPVGAPLTAAQLAELLTAQGPLGGPVDCVLNVGHSGQPMRVGRVEVGNAPASGGSAEFAAVARGSVVLPRQGSWSVLQRGDGASEPQAINSNLGVPLIRRGPASMTGTNTNPYRFAEAADLLQPDSPGLDYCFVHTTSSSRILFPRPKIEHGATSITSTVTPLVADTFAMLDATGFFPRQDSCIPFPNSSYSLEIAGPGQFTLHLSPNPFTISQPARTMAGSAGMGVALEYNDENSNPTKVAVAISPTDWSFSEADICVRMDLSPFNSLVRIAGATQASTTAAPSFPTSRLVFSSVFSPVQALISFLESLGLPNPLTLAMSNATQKFKMQGSLQLKLPMTLPIPIPTDTPIGKLAITLKVGFGNTAPARDTLLTSSSQWFLATSFTGSLQVPVLPPIYAGGAIGFSMEGDFPSGSTPAKETINLQAGVIVSVGGDLIPGVLSLSASVTYGYQLTIVTTSPQSIGLGLMLILQASGSVLGGLVGISFTAEAIASLTLQPSPCLLTAAATFMASVDVTLGWFLDITVSVTTTYSQSVSC